MTRTQLIDELIQDEMVEDILNKNYDKVFICELEEYLSEAFDHIDTIYEDIRREEDPDSEDYLDNSFDTVKDIPEYLQDDLYNYVKDNYKINHPYLIEV